MESTDLSTPRAQLITTLQMAYSGELAAGFAYRGHWHSVRDSEERTRIKQIEDEEWHHRKLVGEMLTSLGAGPNKVREIRATVVGRVLGIDVSHQRVVCADVRRGPVRESKHRRV